MMGEVMGYFEALARPLSQILIHSLWQGGLIAVILAILLASFRGRDARIRYALSGAALAVMILLSAVTCLKININDSQMSPAITNADNAKMIMAAAGNEAEGVPDKLDNSSPAVGAAVTNILGSGPVVPWFSLVWLGGVMLLSGFHFIGWRRAMKLTGGGTSELGAEWKARFVDLRRNLQVSRPVRLLSSSMVHVPCVIGWIKPVVLLPLGILSGMDAQTIEMIIAHELAHIRRHDILVNYLQTIIETLYFFNPAAWWISRQIRLEREHCCDELVIAGSCDRFEYARALLHLGDLRDNKTGLAVAANGPTLLNRVRNIMGLSIARNRLSFIGVAGIFMIMAVLAFSLGATSDTAVADGKTELVSGPAGSFESAGDDIRGEWEVETNHGKAQLRIFFEQGGNNMTSMILDDFTKELEASTNYFTVKRDAGTFHFEGKFEREGNKVRGGGECYFRSDPEYVEKMKALGYRLRSNRKILTMALHDITLEFASGLYEAGYDDLFLDELVAARVHDVTPEYVAQLQEFGYRGVSMNQLVAMRVHDVEIDFIRGLKELGYSGLSTSKLVEMNVHDVDLDFIYQLKELGYDRLRPDQLVAFQIHDVRVLFIRQLAELGYRDVSPSRLVELCIHDVTPRYIRQLAELGYDDISLSRLVEMKIHDVTPAYIKKLQRRGLTDLTASELVEYKVLNR